MWQVEHGVSSRSLTATTTAAYTQYTMATYEYHNYARMVPEHTQCIYICTRQVGYHVTTSRFCKLFQLQRENSAANRRRFPEGRRAPKGRLLQEKSLLSSSFLPSLPGHEISTTRNYLARTTHAYPHGSNRRQP